MESDWSFKESSTVEFNKNENIDNTEDSSTKTSKSSSGLRPKRHINKSFDQTVTWREESLLNRALYASLQESKRVKGLNSEDYLQLINSEKESTCSPSAMKFAAPQTSQSSLMGAVAGDDSSQDSAMSSNSSSYSHADSKINLDQSNLVHKLHAQRKFAAGSRPNSPSTKILKPKATPKKFFAAKKAKTEDFLTFLCLRGSHVLPPRFDAFKCGGVPDVDDNSSRATTPSPLAHQNGVTNSSPKLHRSSSEPLMNRARTKSNNKLIFKQSPDREIELTNTELGVKPLDSPNKLSDKESRARSHIKRGNQDSKQFPVRRNMSNSDISKRAKVNKNSQLSQSFSDPSFIGYAVRKSASVLRAARSNKLIEHAHTKLKRKHAPDPVVHSSPPGQRTRSNTVIPAPMPSGRQTRARVASAELYALEESRNKSLLERQRRFNSATDLVSAESSRRLADRSNFSTHSSVSLPHADSSERIEPEATAELVDVPVYCPSSEQFEDPIKYIKSVSSSAESYGMCRIIPPSGWKPECHISEDIRFTTQMQYVDKMENRWGENSLQLECIRKHLSSQGIKLEPYPMIGGVELDLPALLRAIHKFGGMQSIINKGKWLKLADTLNIPKSAQDRGTRLYDTYCKYLLSYDTLNSEEKSKLETQVLRSRNRKDSPFDEDCIGRGKSKTLSDFFRVAQNTQSVWFDEDPSVEQVTEKYWEILSEQKEHVAVQAAHIDTATYGSGFPSQNESPYSKHGWNFNILQHNSGSILNHVGSVSGVTIPTLHISMLFTTTCWSCDTHCLPYIVYMHTGADSIWYSIPPSQLEKFKAAMKHHVPDLINLDQPVWLPEDTVMISPGKLHEAGVKVCQTRLSQGEYIVVFPRSYTSAISCGYSLSESIHFATADWIPYGIQAAENLNRSCEPEAFSIEQLLISLAESDQSKPATLKIVVPELEKLIEKELKMRSKVRKNGLKHWVKKPKKELHSTPKRKQNYDSTENEETCEISKKICYLSMISNEESSDVYSLYHGLRQIKRRRNLKHWKLVFRYSNKELQDILQKAKARI